MRELITTTFLTLDGVMQAPGGPGEDDGGGFSHGGWSVGYWDADIDASMGETMGRPFELVLGRKTYDIFASHWPHADDPTAELLNSATKHVASRSRPALEWQNSQLLGEDVPSAVRALKEQDGPELQVHGSGDLIQTLLRHGLVDEMRVYVFPLVLGSGKRLFGDGAIPAGLEVAKAQVSSAGVIMATYRSGAAIKYGSFELETPAKA
jgi:dihydrofolate reductase